MPESRGRLYEDFGDETGLGYPIPARTERTLALGREERTGGTAPACVCGQPVGLGVLMFGLCVECCLRVPEPLRLVLQTEYRPGPRPQSELWQDAHRQARAFLEANRPTV